MMQSTGRHPQKRHLPQVGHQKHGTGEDGGAVVHFGGPGQADAVPGDVVRVYAHAAAQK